MARVTVLGPTLRPAVNPGTRSSTTAYSWARLTLTACDIADAGEMGVAAVSDCLVREVSQVKVGDHWTGSFTSAVGLRMLVLPVTRVRHVVGGRLGRARLHDHV